MNKRALIGLDVGEKRIGVAVADTGVRIAVPLCTVAVDGNEIQALAKLVEMEQADTFVVGYPRNQSGESTAQSAYVERFVKEIEHLVPTVVFQDESLTSVIAEQRLKESRRPYEKGDIDAHAAAIILQDYLEQRHG